MLDFEMIGKVSVILIFQFYMISSVNGQFVDLNGKPSLRIPQGVLAGSYRSTIHNVPYVAFEGIPYARPPLGNLRFKAPVQWQKWRGVLDATQKGPLCVQYNMFPIILPMYPTDVILGEENCLRLNVYAPAAPAKEKYPILVHVHGGAFLSGGSDFSNPDTMVEKGIVFISINYRVNIFGFLSLNSTQVPGNAGLKDIVMALKWVQANGIYFNGATDEVTVIGEISGAGTAMILQLSPLSKGLFHKTIAVGGSALNGWMIQRLPSTKVANLADILNLDVNNPSFLNDLQDLDAYTLCEAAFQVPAIVVGTVEDFMWTPVIETKFPKQEAFITKEPIDIYSSKDFYNVPTIIGFANKGFLYSYVRDIPIPFRDLIKEPRAVVPLNWQMKLSDSAVQIVYREIMDFFFRGQAIDWTNHEIVERAVDLVSDVVVLRNVDQTVRLLMRISKKPIYCYSFSYRGLLNAEYNEGAGIQGASNVNELFYLWRLEEIPVDEYSSDGWVRRRIVAMFTNFVKFGNPTPGPCDDLLPTTWLPVSPALHHCMSIGGDVIPTLDPDFYKMKFWREIERRIYAGYYKNL